MTNHLGSSSEREALLAQYPAQYVEWLNEVLGIVESLDSRRINAHEARVLLKQRFAAIVEEYVPECHERIAEYRARVNAEQKAETDARVAYMERQQRSRESEEQRQKQSRDAADRANRERNAKEQKEMEEARDKFNVEQRAKQAEKDRIEAAQLESLIQSEGQQ